MSLYDGNGNLIEISGGTSNINLTGNTLMFNSEKKSVPAILAQATPIRSNIVHVAGYSDPESKTWFLVGLRFKNANHSTSFTFDYSVDITGSCTSVLAYLIGNAEVLGTEHAYANGETSYSDTFTHETKLNSDYVTFWIRFATENNTNATDKIATARTLKIATVPEGLEFVGLSIDASRCPTLTSNRLTFDEEKQYPKYACRWSGKKYFAMGDSITQGVAPYYVSIIGAMLGFAITTNSGDGGTSMVQLANSLLSEKMYQGYDFVTIAHGVNDFDNNPNSPIGTLAEHGSIFDKTTYIGALQYIIETVKSNSPNTEIALIAPIYNPSGEGRTNSVGAKLSDYRLALKSVADSYGLVFINGYDVINASNASGLFADGTHPNAKGQELLGVSYANILANL